MCTSSLFPTISQNDNNQISSTLSLSNYVIASVRAIPVGAISYMDIDGYRYKRDVEFCYDLKLPKSFLPKNEGKPYKFFSFTVVYVLVMPCSPFVITGLINIRWRS